MYYNEGDHYCHYHNIILSPRQGAEGDDISYYCKECEKQMKKLEESTWACPVCGCNSNDKITNTACWCCGWELEDSKNDLELLKDGLCPIHSCSLVERYNEL